MLGATDKTRSPITGLKFKIIFNESIKAKVARKIPVKAQKFSGGTAVPFFYLGARLGWVFKATLRPHHPG
jgi:hypothetical protein